MRAIKHFLSYILIRIAAFSFEWMPYSWIHWIGKRIGALLFYLMPTYRKRTLSNLAIAKELQLSNQDLKRIGKESFQNLATICLEYPRLSREKKLSSKITCENPEIAESLLREGKGIVFFCAHLSNWETLFLEGTSRMPGIAIAKPIKNKRLYRWIVSIREKYGGKIIQQQNAIKEGFKALKKGHFVGIVGDQGMPNSSYSSSFLGRVAFTTTAPALLAYRANCPLMFAETKRIQGGYQIRYSDPIWPNLQKPLEKEVSRMMDHVLSLLQASIKKRPSEWLWQHNRWKKQTPKNVYKRFRHDAICLVLPQKKELFLEILPHLPTLKEIYPRDFLFLFAPAWSQNLPLIAADETFFYQRVEETLIEDYRFKLVFNFTDYAPLKSHYLRLSALEVIDLFTLHQLAKPYLPKGNKNLSEILKRALCRPGIVI